MFRVFFKDTDIKKKSPLKKKVTILDLHYLVPPNAPSTHLSVECPGMSSRAAILSTMRPAAPSSNSCRTSLESVAWPPASCERVDETKDGH